MKPINTITTNKKEVYDQITKLFNDNKFMEKMGTEENYRDNRDILRDAVSEEIGIKADDDLGVMYAYHVQSEALVNKIKDPHEEFINLEGNAVRPSLFLMSEGQSHSIGSDEIEAIAEEKLQIDHPEFITDFLRSSEINRENAIKALEVIDNLDQFQKENILDGRFDRSSELCYDYIADEFGTEDQLEDLDYNVENITRFYRAHHEEGAVNVAKAAWAENEKCDQVEKDTQQEAQEASEPQESRDMSQSM